MKNPATPSARRAGQGFSHSKLSATAPDPILQPSSGPTRRGGRRARDKGNRAERALVAVLRAGGFAAERVPLSGAAGGRYCGDVSVPLLGVDRTVEVKVRANGFGELYRWLDDSDLLVVRADRRAPLVVLPLRFAIEIATHAERASRHPPQKAETAGHSCRQLKVKTNVKKQ
jgi:hypothetical protein